MENEFFSNSGLPPPSAAWHSDQSLDCIFRSADHSPAVQFDSALSSMVSSPAASNSNLSNDNFAIRELIGKLGNINNSGEISPHSGRLFAALNSPPKLNLGQSGLSNSPDFDPGFAERAARFSCFGSRSFNGRKQSSTLQNRSNPLMRNGKLERIASNPELANSQEESTVSEQNPIGEIGLKSLPEPNSRKRKAVTKAKGKDDESNPKRCKENGSVKAEEEVKAPEPPKDYIHVRARRGQATDSHSLAERVRREKISERMKLLQDLVPGCNKVTGKALMLDEIINYVQSLQQQVEFLSMKLASVNTTDSLTSKDIFGSTNSSAPRPIFPLDSSASAFFGHHNEAVDPIGSALCRNLSLQLPQLDDGFGHVASQYMTFCEDDLQSIVQMGFSQNIHGSSQEASQMKIEL